MLIHQDIILNDLTPVIGRAIDFLCKGRNSAGVWSDFLLPNVESDGWVTGYVGSSLAGSGRKEALNVCREVWEIFGPGRLFNGQGGWAFNRWSPEDADSTAWGIRFAIKIGLAYKFRTSMAMAFLERHIRETGGLATFADRGRVRKFLARDAGSQVEGWMAPHTCVTAAAAGIPNFNPRIIPWLTAQQLPEGYWEGYWWSDPEYSSAMAVEAMTLQDGAVFSEHILRAQHWIMQSLGSGGCMINPAFPRGSPFTTALALRILLEGNGFSAPHGKCRQLVSWLIEHQRNDGSWQPSARLRVPDPALKVPDNPMEWLEWRERSWEFSSTDQHALFTTATVLRALIKFAN